MKKTLSKVTWLVLVLVIIASLTLLSCSSSPTTTAKAVATSISQPATATPTLTPKSGGVLRVVASNTTQVFGYPGDMGSAGSPEVCSPCVESLCGVDARGFFTPNKLSTAYQVAPDGKSMTFTLRKGVKFHDGTDFNAQAAKWNLDISKKKRLAGTETWTSDRCD